MAAPKAPIRSFSDVADLEAYMSRQPARSAGFWLKLSKAAAPDATISKQEAVEAALCCGWIDGQLARLDENHFLVRMTPRRRGSRWSAKNRGTADRLAREGRLKVAGLDQIEQAKADGRWDAAYQSQGKAQPPPDLLKALARNAKASKFFGTLDRANRYSVIYRVNDAKRPQTRSRRIAEFVEMLARGETIHPRKAAKPFGQEGNPVSAKPIAERLQVKGARRLAVVDAPGKLDTLIGARKARACLAEADVILQFAPDRRALEKALPAVLKKISLSAILWVAYPKLTSEMAGDLSRDVIHALAPEFGLDTVSQIAIDADWSALRLKRLS